MTVFICILPGLFTAVEHSSILPVEVISAKYVTRLHTFCLAGNANTEKILSSVGIGADSTRVNKVVNELKVKSVEELIASCREMPSGGAAPTAAAEEKEEKKKEVSEPRSMTTWASVSLGALAFLPPKTHHDVGWEDQILKDGVVLQEQLPGLMTSQRVLGTQQ
ncbi:predicted protein [Culex quinquefasciatus]|uniref:Predicted protein n=1 Tax=Culex quinquefasciatus TaxID=7176 RepID=B0XFG3_CULQU|nr:predicted protein [Culex quinquefasciatus]|eukprot:XP_001868385.1 predicted protein [Culex quinquefasciatus]